MAMQSVIRAHARVDLNLNITVEWFDTALRFSHLGNLNFTPQVGETGGQFRTRVQTEIDRIGVMYQLALSADTALEQLVDQARNVP